MNRLRRFDKPEPVIVASELLSTVTSLCSAIVTPAGSPPYSLHERGRRCGMPIDGCGGAGGGSGSIRREVSICESC